MESTSDIRQTMMIERQEISMKGPLGKTIGLSLISISDIVSSSLLSGSHASGRKLLLSVKSVVFAVILLLSVGSLTQLFGQTDGDYRSIDASGNWADYTQWQRYNGSSWVTATSGQGYPGQYSGQTYGAVTIQSGHTRTLNASPTYAIGAMVITGTLNSDATARTLSITGDWTNNGTFTAGTSTIILSGTNNSNIYGNSTSAFYILTINKNATATTITSSGKAFNVGNNLIVTQGNLILQATDANYSITNDLTVAANGTVTHSVSWDTAGKQLSVGGNIAIDGIFTYSVRSHVQMNSSGTKTIRTGANASSAFSILTLLNGTFNASGTLKVNDNFWAMFG